MSVVDRGSEAAGGAGTGKPHYVVLDGLRGVASVLVVIFHLFEAWSHGDPRQQIVNHGYLAVDFFFLLSGFVIAYAYDDRWDRMSPWQFFKRRLIRLQPMIIVGSLLGAVLFAFQKFSIYPLIHDARAWQVVAVMLIGFTMIPLPRSADIRGWTEMYPLNGPAWSLFYEYVANVLYAVGLRKLSIKALSALVGLAALALVYLAVFGPRGDLIGGWGMDPTGIQTGLSRVTFPFFAGVLLFRLNKRIRIRHSFLACSLLLVLALSLPRIGPADQVWMNGLYEALCVIVLFPLIVAVGAGEKKVDGPAVGIARVFGDLSYPLYITHYPLIYIYTGWVADHRPPPGLGAAVAVGAFCLAVTFAWLSVKLYDEPVRRWLASRLLRKTVASL
jgi:peptidoglycan/LPS O-acetylase OafA/YrhL